jgi:transposase
MRGCGEVSNEEWAVLEPLPRFRQRPDGRGRPLQDARAVLSGGIVDSAHWFRRLVTRYEYHIENFLGMVRLGFMRIMLRYL